MPRGGLQSLIDSGDITARPPWPGFGGGGPFQEYQLWTQKAIELFNGGIQ